MRRVVVLATFTTAETNGSSSGRHSSAITSTGVPSGSLASGGSTTTPFLTVPLKLTLMVWPRMPANASRAIPFYSALDFRL
jgi:hypothetical protein